MTTTNRPIVSVVLATYNRSYVLRHAMQSVLDSRLSDWELIVVGDHCTDDTADVVAAFDDPRVNFVNLPANCGEQSAPNNAGIRLARGRYIAFLNHDDLYFPDHLGACVDRLESTGADLVWVPFADARPVPAEALERGEWRFEIGGVPRRDGYDPLVFVYASAWVLKRELIERVGPWRSMYKSVVTPSQDWLFRAWRSGARLEFSPHVSLLVIPGGARADSYVTRRSPEHDVYAREMRENPRFRKHILALAAIHAQRAELSARYALPLKHVALFSISPLYALCARLGVHPHTLKYTLLRSGGKGSIVNAIRRVQGLGAAPKKAE